MAARSAPLLTYVKRVAPHCSSAAIISLSYVPGAGHGARRIFDVARTDPPFAYAGEPADERVTIDFRRGDTFIALDMHDLDVGEMGYGITYISIAAVYDALALATTVRNDCK